MKKIILLGMLVIFIVPAYQANAAYSPQTCQVNSDCPQYKTREGKDRYVCQAPEGVTNGSKMCVDSISYCFAVNQKIPDYGECPGTNSICIIDLATAEDRVRRSCVFGNNVGSAATLPSDEGCIEGKYKTACMTGCGLYDKNGGLDTKSPGYPARQACADRCIVRAKSARASGEYKGKKCEDAAIAPLASQIRISIRGLVYKYKMNPQGGASDIIESPLPAVNGTLLSSGIRDGDILRTEDGGELIVTMPDGTKITSIGNSGLRIMIKNRTIVGDQPEQPSTGKTNIVVAQKNIYVDFGETPTVKPVVIPTPASDESAEPIPTSGGAGKSFVSPSGSTGFWNSVANFFRRLFRF